MSDSPRIYGTGLIETLELTIPLTITSSELNALDLGEPVRLTSNVDCTVQPIGILLLAGQEIWIKIPPATALEVTWIVSNQLFKKKDGKNTEYADEFVAFVSISEAHL